MHMRSNALPNLDIGYGLEHQESTIVRVWNDAKYEDFIKKPLFLTAQVAGKKQKSIFPVQVQVLMGNHNLMKYMDK